MKRTTTSKVKVPDYPVTMGRTGLMNINQINLFDMLWGMTNLVRFTGKSDRVVTNAAHSMHCYAIACDNFPDNHQLQLYALVHDLPEAYYGDFPGFLKAKLGADFQFCLDEMDEIILTQLGLGMKTCVELHPELKQIDRTALALEAEYAFDKFEPYHWPPPELYNKTDIISGFCEYDNVGQYNLVLRALERMAEHNETLKILLDNHLRYPHPKRGCSPCIAHAFSN